MHEDKGRADVPFVRLPAIPLVALDVVAWGAIHTVSGYAVHRLPVSSLQRDTWLLRPRSFERDGRSYVQWLHIKRWKDLLPEAGALFPGGVSKRHVPADEDGGLERFVVETRRAELGHWLALAAAPVFAVWNPPGIAAIMVAYGVAVNLPFIAIQRYNRIRATRVLRSRSAPSPAAARARTERGTSGSSMP
jgi:glycosyl-4,4'-diaponeurosporenoate acyltransferase